MITGLKYHKIRVHKILLVALLLIAGVAKAQYYTGLKMDFGKNRVQYRDFLWTYYSFNRFDTYFYLNGKELAIYTSKYADKYLSEMESKLETRIHDKIQFIVFNNLSDLKQANLGQEYNTFYNTGGVTHIIGRKVLLYFEGDHAKLEKQIRAGITQVILNELISGTSVGSQVKSGLLINFPEWFSKGLVSFYSEEWNTDFDNQIRDAVVNKRIKKFASLQGEQAILAGHSLWNFISLAYGADKIPSIIYMARVSRSVDAAFLYVLGVDIDQIIEQWKLFYNQQFEKELGDDLDRESFVFKKPRRRDLYQRVKLDPNGKYQAYVTNNSGKKKVWLYDKYSGKRKKLIKKGFTLDDKNDLSYPLLSWHPSGKVLSIIIEEKGYLYLYFYDVDRKKSERRKIVGFEKILDFSYSPDGRNFVMSAVQKGQSDIFVYEIASGFYDQITKDVYDDLNPQFINKGQEIAFCSNRTSDTITKDDDYIQIIDLNINKDVFIYQYLKKSPILKRITNTPRVDERYPQEYANDYLSYLADNNGVFNRYIARFDSVIAYIDTATHYRYFTHTVPLTNFNTSIIEHHVNPQTGKIADVVLKDGRYFVSMSDMVDVSSLVPQELRNTFYREALSRQADQEKGLKQDAVSEKIVLKPRKRFRTVIDGQTDEDVLAQQYTAEGVLQGVSQGTGDGSRTTKDGFKLPSRRNYYVQYSINELVNQIDFNFLQQNYHPYTGGRGPVFLQNAAVMFFQASVSDLMEDYRITAGIRPSFDLSNNEYIVSFANYKRRLDQEWIFYRSPKLTYFNIQNTNLLLLGKYVTHQLAYKVSWPFNRVLSLRGRFAYRVDRSTIVSVDPTTINVPSVYDNTLSVYGELVFDGTRNLGMNLYEGTRWKIFAEGFQVFANENKNVFVAGFDFRNYQRIHRTLIWANRFAVGTSFGKNKLIYYMGGVDNWIKFTNIQDMFSNEAQPDQSQNYLYQTLATNMRGFPQNVRNGNNFAVINSELRFPVFRYLLNRNISSGFVNNFQLVAFGDVGAAFDGMNPFSEDNITFLKEVYQKPFFIELETRKSPIVGGMGLGARTTLLGYFVRGDVAWGIEDNKINDPMFYFSVSLDF